MRLQNQRMAFHFSWKFIKHIDSHPVKYFKCIIRNSRKIPKENSSTHIHIYLGIRSLVCIQTKLCDFSLSHTHKHTLVYSSHSLLAINRSLSMLLCMHIWTVCIILLFSHHSLIRMAQSFDRVVFVCIQESEEEKQHSKSKLMCSKFFE